MIKENDFIELDYTGIIKDDKIIFDTTIEKTAKDNNIFDDKREYKPIIICVGENHLIKGLDEQVTGKEIGKYTIEVKDVDAFGKKSTERINLMPMNEFKKQNINPFVGLDIEADGRRGIIRSISGGRVLVDFNHPLSSKDLTYEIDIKRIVTDNKEKVEGLLKLFNIPFKNIKAEDKKIIIESNIDIPKELTEKISELTNTKIENKKV